MYGQPVNLSDVVRIDELFRICGTPKSEDVPSNLKAISKYIKEDREYLRDQDHEGFTLLGRAAMGNNGKICAMLISKGAQIEQPDKYGCRPVHCAAMHDSDAAIRALKCNGADMNAKDHQGFSALHLAAYYRKCDSVSALTKAKANLEIGDNGGGTPLHLAARKGWGEVVAILLRAGANCEAERIGGYRPLYDAALYGQEHIVDQLIQAGAKVNAQSSGGRTALHYAAIKGKTEVTRRLLDVKADINAITEEGLTPTMLAAKNGHVECLKELLKKEPNIDAQQKNKRGTSIGTALMLAIDCQKPECVAVLIGQGASTEVVNSYGRKALSVAVNKGDQQICNQLLQARATLSEHGEELRDASFCATLRGYLDQTKPEQSRNSWQDWTPRILRRANDQEPQNKAEALIKQLDSNPEQFDRGGFAKTFNAFQLAEKERLNAPATPEQTARSMIGRQGRGVPPPVKWGRSVSSDHVPSLVSIGVGTSPGSSQNSSFLRGDSAGNQR